MKKYLICKKIGMTEVIQESGKVEPVSVLKLTDMDVLEIKNFEKNGYQAVVVGYDKVSEKKLSKPRLGIFKKLNKDFKKSIVEYRMEEIPEDPQSLIDLKDVMVGASLIIKSKSKGKGFSGTIKKHNFQRGPESHGSKNHRRPGSIGAGTSPSRVLKGTRMAGKMGSSNVTTKSILIKLDSENGCLYVRGPVPGSKGTNVFVEVNQ